MNQKIGYKFMAKALPPESEADEFNRKVNTLLRAKLDDVAPSVVTCSHCNGSGEFELEEWGPDGPDFVLMECAACDGKGFVA